MKKSDIIQNKSYYLKKTIFISLMSLIPISLVKVGSSIFNYSTRINESKENLDLANEKCSKLFNELNIKDMNITTVGNSVMFGYSAKDESTYLLDRNIEFINNEDIEVNKYNYARPQDNYDAKLLYFLNNNTRISELNNMLYMDLISPYTGVNNDYVDKEEILNDFPLSVKNDLGLQDIIKQDKDANIILYSGCTGNFLNVVTRGGDLGEIFNSFDADISSIEAFIQTTYSLNPRTQIYISGVPNVLNINLTDIINNDLQKMCDKYPNVTYVESAPLKLIYNTEDGNKVDIHYDKKEYDLFIANYLNAIAENYVSNDICISLDLALSETSEYIQFDNRELRDNYSYTKEIIEEALNENNYTANEKKIGLLNFIELMKYRFPNYYYYDNKENVTDILNNEINIKVKK